MIRWDEQRVRMINGLLMNRMNSVMRRMRLVIDTKRKQSAGDEDERG